MHVVGIDPGLTHTGIAVLVGRELVAHRLLTTEPDDGPELQRVADLAQGLWHFLEDLAERRGWLDADERYMAIEAQHFQQVRLGHEPSARQFRAEAGKAASTLRVAQVTGAMIAVAARFGLEVMEVSPSRAKRAVANSPKVSKEQVQAMVAQLYGVDGLSEHEADAAAVATAARHIVQLEGPLPEALRALKDL